MSPMISPLADPNVITDTEPLGPFASTYNVHWYESLIHGFFLTMLGKRQKAFDSHFQILVGIVIKFGLEETIVAF